MIAVECPCGKSYSVPERHDGKWLRCKTCERVTPVSAYGLAEAPKAAARPPAPPARKPATDEVYAEVEVVEDGPAKAAPDDSYLVNDTPKKPAAKPAEVVYAEAEVVEDDEEEKPKKKKRKRPPVESAGSGNSFEDRLYQRDRRKTTTFGGGDWEWSYNALFGIMYGPIPVGWIILGIGALIYFAFFNHD